ncbi:MAG: single-stranded DNA-binding protein [Lacrimispora saccharolytica]
MNKVLLMGRLTRDPEIRYMSGEKATTMASYTLAVERRYKREGETTADFLRCIAFGRTAEFAEKYFYKGIRIIVIGRLQTGNYTNHKGQKVYTTDVIVEEQEFAESRRSNDIPAVSEFDTRTDSDGFMNIPDGIDEELPFH